MLKTERLYLRNLWLNDAETMFNYRNDSRCNLYQRYESTSLEYLLIFIEKYSSCTFLSKETEQHYSIALNENDEMIGDISVFYTESDNCFTLGITIAPQFQKNGYAYEVLRELVGQLRKNYPSIDIVALIEKDNLSSIGLFKKLDFVEECYAEKIQSYIYVMYGKAD